MLSISPPLRGAGKGNYYLDLAREDYYLEGGEPLVLVSKRARAGKVR